MAQLPNREKNFADWYQEVIYQAEIVDQAPVRGCFVIRPYGYAIWESIQAELDRRIKATGHVNASFPLFIPESFIKKEAEHVKGFAPELAIVTIAGGKELEEPLVVRPTSETMIHYMFAKWIKSWRDLPMKVNQWCNVVRWELRPRAFLRTTEFLWQEGHTAHETLEEAEAEVLLMLEQYRQVYEDFLAVPVVVGKKSPGETFPGADKTFTLEALMPDGKALQCCTSHLISRDFARAFNMTFQNRDGQNDFPYLTSWGFTTRSVGAVIMTHGDDKGLVLPPRVAPLHAVIIPILKEGIDNEATVTAARTIADQLMQEGLRVFIDEDSSKTPGNKFYHWELKGVPLRIEIGPRDVQARQAVVVNRMTSEKQFVSFDVITQEVFAMLRAIQQSLFERARKNRQEQWHMAKTIDEIAKEIEQKGGFYQTGWCGRAECEQKIKEYKATIRCLIENGTASTCAVCGEPSISDILIAKSY